MMSSSAALAFITLSGAAEAVDIAIDAAKVLHPMNPLYMGCHSDSGFVHEVTGWSSQMLFGESFERPPNTTTPGQSSYAWQHVISKTLAAPKVQIALDPTANFSGWPTQKISIGAGAGTGSAGLANRGLGNEGLYIQKAKPYEGYFFASSAKPVTLEARIETTEGKVLASQQIKHTPPASLAGTNPGFVQHKFTMTPTEGADCVGIAPGSDPTIHCTSNPGTAHVCIKCGAQFTVAVVAEPSAAVDVSIAYVVFQPGEWGRFQGLNARKDVADTLKEMGIKIIRLGGSFCSVGKDNGAYYQWQKWTGPVWERPSIGAHWDSYGGHAYNLIGGWGMFEMIDYAVALGAEPVITTTETSSPAEFADLVEYCWGNATTPMGKKRAADGHPDQYKLRYIELGNEQYNSNYVEQVKAMEARANAVGAGGQLHYMFPSNGGLNAKDAAAAAELKLGNRLVTDLHVGAGGALPVAEALFATHASAGLTDDAAVNFETNAATHTHGRALDEAADLNDFFNAGDTRVLARTASFCHGRAGHFDMFDQAISFFMPNMTWLQPPGHVHAMITATWQPQVVNTTVGAVGGPPPSWSEIDGKGLTCSGSDYRGTANMGANHTKESCLAATEKLASQGVNYAVFPGNGNCYVCAIPGDIVSQLTPKAGAVSFVGKNVIQPMSASAQLSADGTTLVARIVNHGAPASLTLQLSNFKGTGLQATAVTMASDDLAAENTAADVAHVAPAPLANISTSGRGTVVGMLPGKSYTVFTMRQSAA